MEFKMVENNVVEVELKRRIRAGGYYRITGSIAYGGIITGVVKVNAVWKDARPENIFNGEDPITTIGAKIKAFIEVELDLADNEEDYKATKEDLENQPWVIYTYIEGQHKDLTHALPLREFINHTSTY